MCCIVTRQINLPTYCTYTADWIRHLSYRLYSNVLFEYSCGSKSANPEIWKSEFRYSEIAFFVLGYLSISMGILVKALPYLRCVAAFTNILIEIYFGMHKREVKKSDFHIAGQRWNLIQNIHCFFTARFYLPYWPFFSLSSIVSFVTNKKEKEQPRPEFVPSPYHTMSAAGRSYRIYVLMVYACLVSSPLNATIMIRKTLCFASWFV